MKIKHLILLSLFLFNTSLVLGNGFFRFMPAPKNSSELATNAINSLTIKFPLSNKKIDTAIEIIEKESLNHNIDKNLTIQILLDEVKKKMEYYDKVAKKGVSKYLTAIMCFGASIIAGLMVKKYMREADNYTQCIEDTEGELWRLGATVKKKSTGIEVSSLTLVPSNSHYNSISPSNSNIQRLSAKLLKNIKNEMDATSNYVCCLFASIVSAGAGIFTAKQQYSASDYYKEYSFLQKKLSSIS